MFFYAVMIINRNHQFYLDYLDLDGLRQTSDNIREAFKVTLGGRMDSVKAVVTDSRNAMIKFRRDLSTEFPHIVPLSCVSHTINLVCKVIFTEKSVKPMGRKNTALT